MIKYTTAICLCCFLSESIFQTFAQSNTMTSGGNASGRNGAVNFSIGQIDYLNASGSGGSVTQGVQQPYEIFIVTSIPGTSGIQVSISVYPNPTKDILHLQIENYTINNLSYQLFNLNGQIILSDNINNTTTIIPTGNLAAAPYFLNIIDSTKEIKTFKIIKTQ